MFLSISLIMGYIKMLKIAICDDEIIDVNNIKKLTQQYFSSKNITIEIQTFTSAKKLLDLDFENFDILFLDVEMDEFNGIEVAKEIRKTNKTIKIIYISFYIDYAMSGYEVRAFNFLLKPQLDATFNNCMDNLVEEFYIQQEEIEIVMDYAKYKIPIKDIMYIESDVRILKIFLNGESTYRYKFYGQLSNFDNLLSNKGFLRTQKSFLVNMNYIKTISGYYVHLNNNKKLKASIKSYREILKKWTIWLGAI